jgi:hypothetical protein
VAAEPSLDIEAILRTLAAHGVEYIVVGGICAVLHGAPLATFDLDIVHSRNKGNVGRLLSALRELDAYYRAQPNKRIRPSESHLSSAGHQLLMTRFGPLDVLGLIGDGREYPDLAPHTIELQVDELLKVRLLDLETLIQSKQETAGEKDLAVLNILRRVLEEKSRG